MPTGLDRESVRKRLEDFELQPLFIEDLGWDHGGENLEVNVAEKSFSLEAIAHKRGMVAYRQLADSGEDFPDYLTRQKIEKQVTKAVREHIIVYTPNDHSTQHWQWVKREPGQPDRSRSHLYNREQSGESLIQKLEHLAVSIEEEEDLSIVDVSGRVRAAFDVERVTKRFYDRFKTEHQAFLSFINGIHEMADREWYASIMLNRMMFIYFIQKRGFLNGDIDYLRNRLSTVQEAEGYGKFHGFYRLFLMRLFHEGLGQPEAGRPSELTALIGNVPYLNGGLFDVHDVERENPQIEIPDEAFKRIFDFFDAYQWHLDDRPLHNDNEINPDVLGYIFEKYINQKQMGAYYTKEDITGYISRNTIIPFLFDEAKKHCPIAFKPGGGVWRLLSDEPDRYFHEAVRHGITYDVHKGVALDVKLVLPVEIVAGQKDVSKRETWNEAAPAQYALPTETWREHVARRERYEELYAKLSSGEVTSINDLITYNLDIEQFAQDVISSSEGPELVRAFWKAVTSVSILDPTCGSGAFLFTALNILEPIYSASLESMQQFLDDQATSNRQHHPESLGDFRRILDQVERHENVTYFILKSIIVSNLYGVDIMEEAVEICKLRLFLKLVAQLETYEQIEPLPDIDFNMRAGNTLVGFASLDEFKRALGSNLIKQYEIPKIEERASDANQAFRGFQLMQTEHGLNADDLAHAKSALRDRLNELRTELDVYLATDYNVKITDQTVYEQWRESHQPFHWFVEFYGIMQGGGFDVIIGNPPFLDKDSVSYSIKYSKTERYRAVHAMCVERSLALLNENGGISMIMPMSLVSTQRMKVLQEMLETGNDCWYSNYSLRPSKLFNMADQALTIFVAIKVMHNGMTFSTKYLKWHKISRMYLFPTVRYTVCGRNRAHFWLPKLGHSLEHSILTKCASIRTKIGIFSSKSQTTNAVYYRTTGGRYWKIFTDFAPKFSVNGITGSSSRETSFGLADAKLVKPAIAILSSDVFWWWYTITSNLRDLNPYDWRNFPVPESAMSDPDVLKLGAKYVVDLQTNSTMERARRITGVVETQSFKVQKSKPIIDEIDRVLAEHYGFTDEELDFIVNYDIKYRMGR